MKITDVRKTLKKHPIKVYSRRSTNLVSDIAIHHSLTLTGSAEAYANFHVVAHNWPGIGYHFVIEKDGTIKWCNDLENMSYHIGNSNKIAVGICLTGDFRTQKPTSEQEASLRWLCNVYLPTKLPNLKSVKGHNEYPGYNLKQCPVFDFRKVLATIVTKDLSLLGRDCYRFTCKGTLVKNYQEKLLKLGEKLPRFGSDSDFGQETEDATKAFQSRHKIIVDGIAGTQTLNKAAELIKAIPAPITIKKEEPFMLDKAIVINTFADYPAVERLAKKLSCPIYLRETAEKTHQAKELIICGGFVGKLKAGKITDLSGHTLFDTYANIGKKV